MDRRSWPWKKKTSEKVLAATDSLASLSNTTAPQIEQDELKTVKYVQITAESYSQLSGLEDQVNTLNEKLSATQSEMIVKDSLVKQHAKVAEEAVSGWEKAEAEALALKQQLESVMLLKLAAEERSSHLDGAIKECMKQLRNVKEDSENKLHDIVLTKTRQWEVVKAELEEKINDFEQELLKASTDSSMLSRSLQERTSLLMKVSEEKSQVDAQVEVLKSNLQSCEREINSMKYELHVVNKELEIRNEEKNMSMRSAEVANKQHLEDVKKIAKLEAECQRLRVLVRKRLPGPAALAQMKLEVENLGRYHGETSLRRSPSKGPSSPHISQSDFTLESSLHLQKENEFLAARLLTMEEQMKVLKEALANRHRELQASRKMCAKFANKLQSMEAHFVLNQHDSRLKFSSDFHFENKSNPPSLTSMSEDGIDEDMSYSDSWASSLMADKKDKDVRGNKSDKLHNLELMDDFLEMEKLACISTETDEDMKRSDGIKHGKDGTYTSNSCVIVEDAKKQRNAEPELSPNSTVEHASKEENLPFLKLKSRLTSTFETQPHESIMKQVLEDNDHIVRDSQEEIPQHSFVKEGNGFTEKISEQSHYLQDVHNDVEISSTDNGSPVKFSYILEQDLKNALSDIQNFFATLCKEGPEVQSDKPTCIVGLSKDEEFTAYIDRVICKNKSLHDFVLDLFHILLDFTNFEFRIGTPKVNKGGSNGNDFIDKELLLENQPTQNELTRENLSSASSLVTNSSPFPEVEGSPGTGFMIKCISPTFSLGDFENLKLEKESVEVDLASCKETLDHTKSTLVEVGQQLSEHKLELASCQKSNSLAETQLKCMAESYKTLESRKEELEAEVGHLRTKAETLDYELQVEKLSHQEDVVKYNELQVQMERNRKCSTSSFPLDTDSAKTQQEREFTAAAEKLAECQETIFLLGRQLNAIRNSSEQMDTSPNKKSQLIHDALKAERSTGFLRAEGLFSPLHSDHPSPLTPVASAFEQSSQESPLNGHIAVISPADTEQALFTKSPLFSNHQKQKVCRSSTSSSPSSEKHGKGFRRIFSRGKIEC